MTCDYLGVGFLIGGRGLLLGNYLLLVEKGGWMDKAIQGNGYPLEEEGVVWLG